MSDGIIDYSQCSYCNEKHEELFHAYYQATKHFDFEDIDEETFKNGFEVAFHWFTMRDYKTKQGE